MSMKNLDDLLASTNNLPIKTESVEAKPAPKVEPKEEKAKTEELAPGEKPEEDLMPQEKRIRQFRKDKEAAKQAELGNQDESLTENRQSDDLNAEDKHSDDKKESGVDEYGNKVESKERLYTEAELQQRIRDRFSRGRWADMPPEQQIQEAVKDFKPDPNSEETWETQLGNFVDNRLETREKKAQEQRWKEQEARAQTEFQSKFNNGMAKYSDFVDIVDGKPITNAMMMAARSMKDPAAFIYTAAKNHSKELERIAALPSSLEQATEIGRLEERMRKNRNVTSTPKPIKRVQSDVYSNDTAPVKKSVDDLIREDGNRKLRRR